ncbi:phosphatidylinositol-glycan biosynthesis class F protein-like [Ruditapes philippinarum]|uniref:phosphatidylinositol-glycan biosynthesis class F protein-like n=1 Tax=Ruditapes philippinarum TaxID=129788 RepID=UPI00295BCEE0|nr:phosphatidylinositol-glycan biosynthesis class F protein-like [Ruditapes philippinarum]
MAAPMVSNNSISKKTLRNIVIGNVTSAIILILITYIPFHGKSQLDIVSNPLGVTKFLSASVMFLHGILHFLTQHQSNKGQKFRLGILVKSILKSALVFAASLVFFHVIAIMFGAAFINETAETFHFAMMLSSTTVGPLLIHLQSNVESWSRVFVFESPDLGMETTVFISSITSVVGAWLGAFPIPLDWDKPWQAWPITCVLGALTGHCVGILVASVHVCLQVYKQNKFKLT